MKRYAWHAYLLPGKLEEYTKRHREIWPEMIEVLRQAGIQNYSIWNDGTHLLDTMSVKIWILRHEYRRKAKW